MPFVQPTTFGSYTYGEYIYLPNMKNVRKNFRSLVEIVRRFTMSPVTRRYLQSSPSSANVSSYSILNAKMWRVFV